MKCPKCGDARAEAFTPSFWTCPACDAPEPPPGGWHPYRVLSEEEIKERDCQRRWWYSGHVLTGNREDSPALIKGREIHEQAEVDYHVRWYARWNSGREIALVHHDGETKVMRGRLITSPLGKLSFRPDPEQDLEPDDELKDALNKIGWEIKY